VLRLAQSLAYAYAAGGGTIPPKDVDALHTMALAAGVDVLEVDCTIEAAADVGASLWKTGESQRRAAERGERPWYDMIPLSARAAAPSIDRQLLPTALAPWLCDVADRACLPVELVAVPAMVALGSVIGSHMRVRPETQSAWTTPPNLWGAIVAPSGVMKSHAVAAALGPVKAMEKASIEAAEAEERHAKIQRIMLEADLKRAKNRKDPDYEEIANLTESLESLEVQARRYLTNDPTVEKLGELFEANPRGLLLVRDELAGWLSSMAKAGAECSRAFYLEAWGGDASYTFDRIGRGTIVIPTMCLSVIGAIQPGKLAKHIQEAVDGGEGDDGLLQRIQLLVWPDETPEWRRVDGEPHEGAKGDAYRVFAETDYMCSARWPDPVRFSPEGQAIYDRYRDEIESRVRSGEFASAHSFGSHVGKYRGLAPSLALVLWVADGGRPPGAIDAYYADQAVAWCRWLELHARKMYAAELEPEVEAAAALAARIRDGSVPHLTTVRSIGQRKWSGLATSDAVRLAIDALELRCWLRRETLATGGRPSVVVALHPKLRGGA